MQGPTHVKCSVHLNSHYSASVLVECIGDGVAGVLHTLGGLVGS